MQYATTQYEMLVDNTVYGVDRYGMTDGIYVPETGMPRKIATNVTIIEVIRLACSYCATRHLFDREKEEESLKALLCLACGAPLPFPEE